MAKSMKLGGGGRFVKLKNKLAHEKGVKDLGAVAAAAGRAKYGQTKMTKMAIKGKKGK